MWEPDLSKLRVHDKKKFHQWKNTTEKNNLIKFVSKVGKTLYYIASQHTANVKSTSYKLIKNIIEQNAEQNTTKQISTDHFTPKQNKSKIDIVILEGIPFNLGLDPDFGMSHDHTHKKLTDFKNETDYAVFIATKNNIHYCGIECTNEEIYNYLIEKKISPEDILLVECLKIYKKYSHLGYGQNLFIKEIVEWTIPNTMNQLSTHIEQFQEKYNFLEHFKIRFKKPFIFGKTSTDYVELVGDKFTNKIINTMYRFRDIQCIKNLYHYINKYDNIVYIMCMQHLYMDIDVLKVDYTDIEFMF